MLHYIKCLGIVSFVLLGYVTRLNKSLKITDLDSFPYAFKTCEV